MLKRALSLGKFIAFSETDYKGMEDINIIRKQDIISVNIQTCSSDKNKVVVSVCTSLSDDGMDAFRIVLSLEDYKELLEILQEIE